MNQNESRTLWISVGAALFAVFLLYSYTEQKSKEVMDKYGKKVRVLVTTKDVNEMETIDETMVELVERPDSFREPGSVSDPEAVIGRVALAPMKKGEQILDTKIMTPGPVTGLALQISPSKRAVAIPIDETRAVARLLNPGDRIDLVAALDVGKGPQQRREIKTIMQDVTVLATGPRVWNELPRLYEKQGREDYVRSLRGDTSFNTITVEASPEDAQNLIYILSTSPGSLYVTLRHPSDHNRQSVPRATIETVMGQVPSAMVDAQFRQTASTPAVTPQPAPAPEQKPKRRGPFKSL